ncbi:uncharacterized protein LOC131854786 [Achroia grisella]|uniref:uncharacterized protein LOC131854786 n=1 Tax=Achroia grisella TaxID=688607 RepID=UPI0027D2CF6B|nr:uncharacterized protein LOC131854786 [Achroia grisella]
MVSSIFPVLLFALVIRCKCDATNGYGNTNSASQFGELLKPPPPPPQSAILPPVPFHGGAGRFQRQNTGYQYLPPPPASSLPVSHSNEFKFPAPFYKQYNFNFVPPPQPFTTSPPPSLFQKVSGWLFSSQQTNHDTTSQVFSNSINQVKKDCNPCNLVPWIPVIRYNLGTKNIYQNHNPTYGPPSPTAYANIPNLPQPFQNIQHKLPQPPAGIPHAVYGPPTTTHLHNSNAIQLVSSTYGPPSPTHTISIASQSPLSSTYSAPSPSYSISSPSYGVPSTTYNQPDSSYSFSSSSQGISNSYNPTNRVPTSTYGTPTSTSALSFEIPNTDKSHVTPLYEPELLNRELPQLGDVEILRTNEPENNLQLPKVTHPASFKNSYGEIITNIQALNIPYSVSATAAESTKIKTEVLPNDATRLPIQNSSLALSNPAPFSLNRGRNIHTLQPVALPNLSVSPLPPIFNARPFKPTSNNFSPTIVQGVNSMQQTSNNVDIAPSIPIVEFTHSIDYPASIIQSPVIDIDTGKNFNLTKGYRNIPNSYIIDGNRDISSQASEDHVSATKSIPDSSFETTGVDGGNELYDTGIPSDLKHRYVPYNHKPEFADLRGIKDEDVDKYRTESNLQNIDSPLLYLKPSAPHKDYENFALVVSTPINGNDYEIYDDVQTTSAPQSNYASGWEESRADYSQSFPQSSNTQENANKPKIVQIIVPYTTNNGENKNNADFEYISQGWETKDETEYQPRKIPTNTENPYISTLTENYNSISTTTEDPQLPITENFDSHQLNTADILNDLYDVKEPPFDIIKLQNTIDDWTEQAYSKRHKTSQRTRGVEKYAKQIPDDFFTTTVPTNYVTSTNNVNYEFYDHEGSSSVQHLVTDERNNTYSKPRKQYNTIERTKTRYSIGKNREIDEIKKLHIYTAASTFRSTTTTPAPWEKIQTSISPLTKEKIYVVTSKPWLGTYNISKGWLNAKSFESSKANLDNESSGSDNLPFKSPRFANRPLFSLISPIKPDPVKSDSLYGFSKSWHQSINDLGNRRHSNNTMLPESFQQKHYTSDEEDTTGTTTEGHNRDVL